MKIFVCIESYLPGTLGGGPVRALVNLIDHLHAEHEFFIFTRNHDYLDASEYPDIEPNVWHQQSKASVYYSSCQNVGDVLLEQLQSVQPDWIYLNGALPPLTRNFLRLRKKEATLQKVPTLLAPHGNLSKYALAHHRIRKQTWLFYTKARGFYNDLIWHAASDRESEQIRAVFGAQASIREVPMAPRRVAPSEGAIKLSSETKENTSPVFDNQSLEISHHSSQRNTLCFVYFGRLSPEKNLPFAFQVLKCFSEANPSVHVTYDLIGSGEPHYESKLRNLSSKLPSSVQVNYIGQLSAEALQTHLHSSFIIHQSSLPEADPSPLPTPHSSRYHALLMPSLTENFSYTVLESLQAGIPVLISDQTPWSDLEASGAGWDLSLHTPTPWLHALEQLAESGTASQTDCSQRAIHYALEHSASYPKAAAQLFEKH